MRDYNIDATLVDPKSKAVNYTVTLNTGTLTVGKAALSVVVDKTKAYGTVNPTLIGTLTGGNGDVITAGYTTTATQSGHVDAYPITATLADPGTKLGNYTLTKTPGTLTGTKATLNVTADDKTKLYGGPNPAFTVSYNGLVTR